MRPGLRVQTLENPRARAVLPNEIQLAGAEGSQQVRLGNLDEAAAIMYQILENWIGGLPFVGAFYPEEAIATNGGTCQGEVVAAKFKVAAPIGEGKHWMSREQFGEPRAHQWRESAQLLRHGIDERAIVVR